MSVKLEAPKEASLDKFFSRYLMLNILRQLLKTVRVPLPSHAVHREECMYTFDSPDTDTGLYVNLSTFIGFGEEFVHEYVCKTGLRVFLHIKREKLLMPNQSLNLDIETRLLMATPAFKISQMAFAAANGQTAKNMAEYRMEYHIVVLPDRSVNLIYPDCELQHPVVAAVEEILQRQSVTDQVIQSTLEGHWPIVVEYRITRYSESLLQHDKAEPVKPRGLRCAICQCLTNLWMNLTDGAVHCSSVPKADIEHLEYDHAYQHFMLTGYPLIIRLNTINANAPTVVYSFPEGMLVKDINLGRHLRRFGIVLVPTRTAPRTKKQQQMELNDRFSEWYVLTEIGNKEPEFRQGPGYTGMRNLGNTCYLNATMQLIFMIQDFVKRFSGNGAAIIFRKYITDPLFDFNLQLAKLGHGLMCGKYCADGITPALFKHVVCDEHPVLRMPNQQDAYLFYQTLINMVSKAFPSTATNPAAALKILFEDCFFVDNADEINIGTNAVSYDTSRNSINNENNKDNGNNIVKNAKADDDENEFGIDDMDETEDRNDKINDINVVFGNTDDDIDDSDQLRKYKHFTDYCIRLPIPVTKLNACDDDDPTIDIFTQERTLAPITIKPILRQKISFNACLEAYFKTETSKKTPPIDAHIPTTAYNTRRLCNMPDYVMFQLCKFVTHDDWTPKKLDVDVDVPWQLDLSEWRSDSGYSGEEEPFILNDALVTQLITLGFSREAAKRACFYTMNVGLDAASTWLKLHSNDMDLDKPFEFPMHTDAAHPHHADDSETLKLLVRMGFNRYYSQLAIFETDGTLDQATKWLLAHDLTVNRALNPDLLHDNDSLRSSNPAKYRDGRSIYDLIGFVSHMGSSSQVGHYVCHVLKDNEWILFDDLRVVKSVNPPKNFGYLYLYKRCS